MLVPYTPVSMLSAEEKARLQVMVSRMQMEGLNYINFEGKVLQANEVLRLRSAGARQILHD